MSELLPQDYPTFLQGLRQAQTRAALAVRLYWQIGRDLEAAVRQRRWGEKVIERVAADLRREFPGVERNLERTRAFYQAYPDDAYSGLERTRQVGIYA